MNKETVQELLNVCEQQLEDLKANSVEKAQLESMLEDTLEEASRAIDEAWESGEDMTNENNWYIKLTNDQQILQ